MVTDNAGAPTGTGASSAGAVGDRADGNPSRGLRERSAARIRTWTIGTKIQGAAVTPRRIAGASGAPGPVSHVVAPISAEVPSLAIAMPTYRRPETLAAVLPELVAQAAEVTERGLAVAEVLVIDNDDEPTAAGAVSALGGTPAEAPTDSRASAAPLPPVPLRYLHQPEPGIAAARNAALEAAGTDLVAFIDDDERPRPGWLAALLRTWREYGHPAAVAGLVVADYESEPDEFLLAGRFFQRQQRPTGTELPAAAAGNLMLDLRQLDAIGLRFDAGFGLTGGEDTLLTRTLAANGGRLVWCNDSVVAERTPTTRLTRSWVRQRSFSHGNSAGLVQLALADQTGRRERLRLFAGGLARVAVGSARHCWGLVVRSWPHRARGLRLAWRGRGMLSAAAGRRFLEYRR